MIVKQNRGITSYSTVTVTFNAILVPVQNFCTKNFSTYFLFRFACQGLKKQPPDQTDKIFQLVKVINRKFLRSKVVPIAEATRKTIQERIAAGRTASGQDIFDIAQAWLPYDGGTCTCVLKEYYCRSLNKFARSPFWRNG